MLTVDFEEPSKNDEPNAAGKDNADVCRHAFLHMRRPSVYRDEAVQYSNKAGAE
jgi:hypothetical protein